MGIQRQNIYICVRMYVYIFIYIRQKIYICVCMFIHTCIHICVCICIYIFPPERGMEGEAEKEGERET